MLNSKLHTALESLFGEIEVSNEGTPGRYSIPPRTSIFAPKSTKKNPKDEYALVEDWGEVYHVNCPICGDTRKRLYFSHMFGASTLDSKKKKVSFPPLCKCQNENCQNTVAFREKVFNVLLGDKAQINISGILTHSDASRLPADKKFNAFLSNEITFPKACKSLYDNDLPESVSLFFQKHKLDPVELNDKYLCRFVPAGTIWEHPVTKAQTEFYEDRLFIPIIQRRILVSWQARRFEDTGDKQYKYLFPAGVKKNYYLYNMDNALRHSDVVICEGAKDTWRVGEQGIALFGKTVSQPQLRIMKNLWGFDGRAYVFLDNDADEDADELANTLRKFKIFPRGVFVIKQQRGDPDDFTYDEIQSLMREVSGETDECTSKET